MEATVSNTWTYILFRYHDANNWPLLREALKKMGRTDLIGNGKKHLIPNYQPKGTGDNPEGSRSPRKGKPFLTKHTSNQKHGGTGSRRRPGKQARPT